MLLGVPGGDAVWVPVVDPSVVTMLDKLTYSGNLDNFAAVGGDRRLRFVQGDICEPVLVDGGGGRP